ncbi:hypothetical protein IFM89_026487 [Coptis chinensis]|uniref:Uncharacterized protein n=1 Tax=Coptis chinensis TaxID=261450 RepID=A0A835LEA3_9MAGN|nr:hypothetical protein IFM89_014101 [Coptis chinensis]KAF9589620.1 hypothetical protein IFM89_026487 [Coptis chinensis]
MLMASSAMSGRRLTSFGIMKYYEDVVTKRPVHWLFYTGRAADVMTFEVGAVLEDEKWQAPVYCFEKKDGFQSTLKGVLGGSFLKNSM